MGWDTIKANTKSGEFMKLAQGDNVIRIVSSPVERMTHFDRNTNKSMPCSGVNCSICQFGDEAKTKYLFRVIDRADGKIKLLEVGYSVAAQLKAFKEDPEWTWDGEVVPFNVKIKREGSKLDTTYTVIASPSKVPLTDSEKAELEKAKPLTEIVKALNGKAEPVQQNQQETRREISPDEIPF